METVAKKQRTRTTVTLLEDDIVLLERLQASVQKRLSNNKVSQAFIIRMALRELECTEFQS